MGSRFPAPSVSGQSGTLLVAMPTQLPEASCCDPGIAGGGGGGGGKAAASGSALAFCHGPHAAGTFFSLIPDYHLLSPL